MSDDRKSIEKVIRDWKVTLEGHKYDARVNKDSLYVLIKMMLHYGYLQEDIDSDFFKNKVCQLTTHEFSPKPKEWRRMVYKDIDEAVGVWFLPPTNFELTDDERDKIAKSEKAMVDIPKPAEKPKSEPAPKYTPPEFDDKPKEIVPFDRSKYRSIETTPIQEDDDFLRDMGLKKDE